MYTATHDLGDGREIEISADRRGNTLRLRANLVKDGLIEVAHSQDYDLSRTTIGSAIADFTREFAQIARVSVATRPLFPEDLFALRYPAAPAPWSNATAD